MALSRLVAGVEHLSSGPIHDKGGILLGIGGACQHLDQPAMTVTVKGCSRHNPGGVPAVMSGGRLGHQDGQKKGGRKGAQEVKPIW